MLKQLTPLQRFDSNRNGNLSRAELEIAEQILEIELREEKSHDQRKMVWIIVWAMVILTVVLFSPFISDSRLAILSDLIGLIFLGFCGTISAFFGVTAWQRNNATNRPYGYYDGYAEQPDCPPEENRGMLRNPHHQNGEGSD